MNHPKTKARCRMSLRTRKSLNLLKPHRMGQEAILTKDKEVRRDRLDKTSSSLLAWGKRTLFKTLKIRIARKLKIDSSPWSLKNRKEDMRMVKSSMHPRKRSRKRWATFRPTILKNPSPKILSQVSYTSTIRQTASLFQWTKTPLFLSMLQPSRMFRPTKKANGASCASTSTFLLAQWTSQSRTTSPNICSSKNSL